MEVFSLGSLGFWIFVSALVVGGMWNDARKRADKHETLRRIVEKTGTIDEAKLKELFRDDDDEAKPGTNYRSLRITGVIAMFAGAAMMAFFLLPALMGHPFEWWYGGLAIGAGIVILGAGIFFSSRFADPPGSLGGEPSRGRRPAKGGRHAGDRPGVRRG